ncbi:MAG: transglycosylase SLT domain-containing protein, partial [Bacteroidaceae bacterium]|nr:transglycosylase SLT domain-containing protein [Bacteroidaceae bacterium]
MLLQGEGDLIGCTLPDSLLTRHSDIVTYGDSLSHWSVRTSSTELANYLHDWFKESAGKRIALKNHEKETVQSSKRKSKITPRAPIKNRAAGIISDYDNLFKRYAHSIGWDWRLLAAQAYQESGFDPQATSWAGAQGLIQIMPGTAKEL